MSPLDDGAKTPAGENLESLMRTGLLLPSHGTENGGFETISSNGSSFQCFGSVRVSPLAILNLGDVVQKHIDSAQVESRQIDFLPEKS